MTEAEEFQARLLQKIEEWANTEDFKKSKSAKQKLERSANLVSGTQPEILVELFGPSASIPDENRKAMQMVRTMDEKTLNALQIFTLTGQQTKLVGHHEVPANILGQHLRKMPVKERIEIFRNLYDRGIRSGMDPKQIRLLPAMVHYTIAHGGDFSGKKTGALLPIIEGEGVDAFLKRFDKALDVTFEMAQKAADAPLTQAWNAAMRGATEGIGIGTDIPLGAPETPMEFRALATKAFKPIAPKVQTTVLENVDNPAKIQELVAELTKTEGAIKPQLVEQLQQQAPAARQASFDFEKNGGARLKFQAPELPVPPQTPEVQQFSNRLIGTRKVATGLAGAGILAVGPLGTAASAAETTERTKIAQQTGNILDQTQAVISGVSLGADVASYNPLAAVPGALLSTGADAINLIIDGGRAMIGGTATYNRKQLERKERLRGLPADHPERQGFAAGGGM